MSKNQIIELAELKLPPSDTLERQVIADAIGNPDVISEVLSIISEESFTDDKRKYLWQTIVWMYNNRMPIDMVSVYQRTGQIFIDEIQSQKLEVSLAMGFISHANLLHEAETKRRAYFAALTIVQQTTLPQVPEDAIFEAAEELSRKIQGDRHLSAETPLNAVLSAVADDTEKEQQEAMQGRSAKVTTGFPALDYLFFGGFGKGQLVILAARPSVGKTAVMLQFARKAAENGNPALIFSLEMTKAELAKRLLYSTDYVSQKELVGKNVNWQHFENARKEIDKLPIYINDEARSLSSICSRMTTMVNRGACRIAFIDYLSLMKFESNKNMNYSQIIGDVTKELKSAAKRLGIPIVVLVQINRDFAKEGENHAPQLYHLKDSGNIEQDADIVLMLAQGEKYLDMWIRKNRNFRKDLKLELSPNESYSRFLELKPDWLDDPSAPSIADIPEDNYNFDKDEPF